MTIAEFDHLNSEKKKEILRQCCGSSAWIEKMLTIPPAEDLIDLFEDAEEKWYECNEEDWKEAFSHHPKIGDINSLKEKFSSGFAEGEQSSIKQASELTLQSLAEGNKAYEEKFGYIFIVCATSKSAEEMLGILTARLHNDPKEEIKIAMEEQNKITRLRLEKLFDA
ncbi:MAG TPA: 2-oxo-4-hydroxy-4-carboxy-5-ureidoimidazoline decarboxylase [Chitinophagaceae bacterium]|jgi:2-oxo-4-hydroxy-4-carboxy-5-ureidoimidazoline decarboxylase|nr:2-oxo-4-hydroxy-4-carboxy-5-ureidoimidazoline decarboxylase [Chitinophagaceae bacterium]